jgi:hypothetical protein
VAEEAYILRSQLYLVHYTLEEAMAEYTLHSRLYLVDCMLVAVAEAVEAYILHSLLYLVHYTLEEAVAEYTLHSRLYLVDCMSVAMAAVAVGSECAGTRHWSHNRSPLRRRPARGSTESGRRRRRPWSPAAVAPAALRWRR